jgi:hypothetical protein
MSKVTPIIIAGTARPVKYGFAALRAFGDATGLTLKDINAIGEDISFTQAIALVWAGLKDGARVTKEPFNMTLDDVADLLDEDNEALGRVLEVFATSLAPEPTPEPKKSKKK